MFTNNPSNFNASCSLEKIYDLIEIDGILIATGKGSFEIFQIIGDSLTLKSKIPLQRQDDIVTSIQLVDKSFICGHASGELSKWNPGQNPPLTYEQASKIHDGPINKIYLKSTTDVNFVITCSSDRSIKVFNATNNYSKIKEIILAEEVFNIYETLNAEGQDIFLATLGNGKIKALNDSFEEIAEITSRFGYTGNNMNCIAMVNPRVSEELGHFLIFLDGNSLELNIWIKEGSFQRQYQRNPPHHQPFPHSQPHNPPHTNQFPHNNNDYYNQGPYFNPYNNQPNFSQPHQSNPHGRGGRKMH